MIAVEWFGFRAKKHTMALVFRLLMAALLAATLPAQAQEEDAVLLVAHPQFRDLDYRQTVLLASPAPNGGHVGVILNRPAPVRHERTGESIYSGGPVMPRTLVALFRSDEPPEAPAFHVLKRVYLSMHPDNIERQLARPAGNLRLFAGFSGWAPRQLEAEIGRDGWYVLPANEELLFREDTTGMWGELVERARGAKT